MSAAPFTPKLGPLRIKGITVNDGGTFVVPPRLVIAVTKSAGVRSRLPTHLARAGSQATFGGFCGMLTMIPFPSA